MYTILSLADGESSARRRYTAHTLRTARSIAYKAALALRPSWLSSRPVWCEASAWHPHDDADGALPVGGYDVGDDGSAAVIFKSPK